MNFIYVPVMAAKQGEISALSNLQSTVSEKIMPLLELPSKKPDVKLFEKSIVKTAANAGKAWANRPAFLDISKWSPNARTETGIHILEYAFAQFRSKDVMVQPVVGYDRWDDPDYSRALKNIRKLYPITPCIRLDRESIKDDILDPEYFADRMSSILEELDVDSSNCYVLVDFGNVSNTAVPDIISDTETAVSVLRSLGFVTVIVVGGSMPAGVNEAVRETDAEGCIPRFEMVAWKAVFTHTKDLGIVFGDYLIRNPDAAEGIIAKHANAKIRYTIDNQFFIVRGHSKLLDSLTVQHKKLAQKLVASPHYMGASFSWGDSEIFNCSLDIKEIRSPTVMIAVDSNHHIKTVVMEVLEHHSRVVPSIGAATLRIN